VLVKGIRLLSLLLDRGRTPGRETLSVRPGHASWQLHNAQVFLFTRPDGVSAPTALQLADALSKHGVNVDRKKIRIDGDHIKATGTYTATINLHKDIKAKVNFEVFAE